ANLPGAGADVATLDAATGVFRWTPDYTRAGVYQVDFTATDDDPVAPLAGTLRVKIVVTNVNRPPVVDAIPDHTVGENQTLTFTVTGHDPDIPVTRRFPDAPDIVVWTS